MATNDADYLADAALFGHLELLTRKASGPLGLSAQEFISSAARALAGDR